MNEIFKQDTACNFQEDDLQQTDIVDAITSWCEALYGSISLETALTNLVRGLGAEAGTLVRTHMNERHPIRIATYDAMKNVAVRPLDCSFADIFFCRHMENPKPATIWLGSNFAEYAVDPLDVTFENWQDSRKLKEFAVLILAAGPVTRDHIELHFRSPLASGNLATLGTILPAVSRTWATRQVGLITRTVINHSETFQEQLPNQGKVSLLANGNPANLSRAEFRVCLLLSRGLSISNTVIELGVTESTVRTHLRNIYAKSGTQNIAELIFCLIAPQKTESTQEIQCA
ncbi:MAG: helix-turn-helix transcriptional regulator [Paracoccaceae bacterium]